jgi:hypothetical protein
MALFANARWRSAVPASLALIGVAAGLREAMDGLLMPKGLAGYAFGTNLVTPSSDIPSEIRPVSVMRIHSTQPAQTPATRAWRVARRGHLGQLAGNADRV